MDPEVEMDTDDVAGVGSGVGRVVVRVVLTVVVVTGAGVDGAGAGEEGTEEEGEGREVTVLYACLVEVTGTEEVVSPMVVVLEAIRWVVTVEAEVDMVKIGPVAGVFTDNTFLVVGETVLGDPGYTTLGVGLEYVLEGRIEVMTVDKSNRSKHWGLGAVCLVPSHSLAPHSSGPCGSHHPGHTNFEN